MNQNKVNSSTYIIAEVGPNHNGDVNIALKMIEKLASIGVNAVKFQITVPENAYSLDAFKASYQKKKNSNNSPLEMSKQYMLTFEEHKTIYKKCKACNVDYICSAFEMESLKFISENFDMPYYKIPSGEIFSIDLINYMNKRGKSFILSTGMATFEEIKTSINLINSNGKKDITVLHCISNYPAPYKDVNLNVMLELKRRFGYPIGFSDHTIGNDSAIAAVALGATMIEKHVTLDRNLPGPDHKASITIEEFKNLVDSIRIVEAVMGSSEKQFSDEEIKIKKAVRKSIVANKTLLPGDIVHKENITYKRPGTGISPLDTDEILGMRVINTIEDNRIIRYKDLTND